MQIQKNPKGFAFIEWSYGAHDRYSKRVWVNNAIPVVTDDNGGENIEFPVQNARVQTTEKGNYVLKPGKGTVFLHSVRSGYRGSASIELAEGQTGEIVFNISQLHSGLGSLGLTAVALMQSDGDSIDVRWHCSGRRIDQTTGVTRLYADGRTEELIDDSETEALLSDVGGAL